MHILKCFLKPSNICIRFFPDFLVLNDGKIEIDENSIENNAIRPLIFGRKNNQFAAMTHPHTGLPL